MGIYSAKVRGWNQSSQKQEETHSILSLKHEGSQQQGFRMKGKVVYINLSKGGVPKLPVAEALLTREGFWGDVQQNKKYHGGPERAVCMFSLSLIHQLQAEGHPIAPGTTGENLTLDFPDYSLLVPGMVLQIGDTVRLQISDYAPPCTTIKHSFLQQKFTRIAQKTHPGESRLYARVLQEGMVKVGDEVGVVMVVGS